MKVDIAFRLQIIGISIEELESCKNKIEQKALVRKATRKTIKNNKTHPDISKNLTNEVANTITANIFAARDDILNAIDNNEFRVNVQIDETPRKDNSDEVDSPFTKMVNDAHREKVMDELLKKFEPNNAEIKKDPRTPKNGVSNAIATFNDKYFSVRDAIRRIKNKLTTIFNKDNKDDMER